MPRKSAEATAAATFRAGGKHPAPPSRLCEDGKELWDEIVKSRPVDFFKAGTRELLEQFVTLTMVQRDQLDKLRKDPDNTELSNRVAKLNGSLVNLATKLRLTIQSASRIGEGRLDAQEEPSKTSLLGGHAVEIREV